MSARVGSPHVATAGRYTMLDMAEFTREVTRPAESRKCRRPELPLMAKYIGVALGCGHCASQTIQGLYYL
jgi:hypothetical protein